MLILSEKNYTFRLYVTFLRQGTSQKNLQQLEIKSLPESHRLCVYGPYVSLLLGFSDNRKLSFNFRLSLNKSDFQRILPWITLTCNFKKSQNNVYGKSIFNNDSQ